MGSSRPHRRTIHSRRKFFTITKNKSEVPFVYQRILNRFDKDITITVRDFKRELSFFRFRRSDWHKIFEDLESMNIATKFSNGKIRIKKFFNIKGR